MNKEEQFFYAHAGFSYAQEEDRESAHVHSAMVLAQAEAWARREGYSFDWEIDDEIDSSDFLDDPVPYSLWLLSMRNDRGEFVAGLGAIDFGRDETPWANNQRRVYEAEMAQEEMSREG